MAVPKRKMSRANTRMRRSTWKANLTGLQSVRAGGRDMKIPRRLAKAAKLGIYEPVDEFDA
ncbi:MAG: 50S ribosomal protein L32 [Actinomycetaceae bacterium]|nr:50S ribosomal protein L32 [Actinomycetaceae bacterium]